MTDPTPATPDEAAALGYVPEMGEPDEAWCRDHLAHPAIQRYLAIRDAAIEAAAAREALAEVERLRLAIDAALAHLDHEHVGFARQTLARAARASDGGR